MKRFFPLLIALLLLAVPTLAETVDIAPLVPVEMAAENDTQTLDLYCGPTQGFYRHNAQTLDVSKPYVIFGQYDCWAMAAQGTKDAFGPVGWIEAALLADMPYEPQLAFEDGFAAIIEETAAVTDNPLAANPFEGWTAKLEPGAEITVLAQFGGWLYVQGDIGGTPARVFIKADTVF